VQKEQVHIRSSKGVAGRQGLLRTVDHTEVDYLDPGPLQQLCNPCGMSGELLLQAWKLTPVSFKPNGE
jgi:hypothetical protein